ncbi:MAG TPA: DICT sensory domain-containing protein [Solirubrobacterales bacterium]|nr:DICT sensory domain-containing protein [Solirubrobacterales bacterium]
MTTSSAAEPTTGGSSTEPALSIGELAARTGVSAATLRMWEARHGFPRPVRLQSGHRRYPVSEADLVDLVLAERRRGLSLPASITSALAYAAREPGSIFASLRRRIGDRPQRLTKRALVALSRAIEDEYLASGERGLLAGSFQRPAHYRAVAPRWRELARLASASMVLASFRSTRRPRGAPVEVPISGRDPLIREWAVICDAPGFAACLAGIEVAMDRPATDADRLFEVIWSFDPAAVRDAAELTISIVAANDPRVAERARTAITHPVAPAAPATAIATADRMVAYLAEELATPAPPPWRQ